MGRETLCTGGKILTNIEERKSTDVNVPCAGGIVSEHVAESAQNLISNLRAVDANAPERPQSSGVRCEKEEGTKHKKD